MRNRRRSAEVGLIQKGWRTGLEEVARFSGYGMKDSNRTECILGVCDICIV